jgi:hypothetical protein
MSKSELGIPDVKDYLTLLLTKYWFVDPIAVELCKRCIVILEEHIKENTDENG